MISCQDTQVSLWGTFCNSAKLPAWTRVDLRFARRHRRAPFEWRRLDEASDGLSRVWPRSVGTTLKCEKSHGCAWEEKTGCQVGKFRTLIAERYFLKREHQSHDQSWIRRVFPYLSPPPPHTSGMTPRRKRWTSAYLELLLEFAVESCQHGVAFLVFADCHLDLLLLPGWRSMANRETLLSFVRVQTTKRDVQIKPRPKKTPPKKKPPQSAFVCERLFSSGIRP